ncbi:hypothetical protein DSO57_1034001 [Entomophthora muscae]|uniref:Uncharacterized protein n=1 Tax=Entomophthora muscae TaxID=34485 RepID=A0ACC2UKE3_9FUNG|nr:hypothetical protein DSO57_1034001 [Entomophthora muscae]
MLTGDIQLTSQDIDILVNGALEARNNSYSPYSKFRVGACLMTCGKKVYSGCNVENASYGGTICAERTAFVKAVVSSLLIFVFESFVERRRQVFLAIAVATDDDCFASPCGMCRQFMNEFSPSLPVYLVNLNGNYQITNLEELLPQAFGPKNLASRINS